MSCSDCGSTTRSSRLISGLLRSNSDTHSAPRAAHHSACGQQAERSGQPPVWNGYQPVWRAS
eukprot:227411-Chlamydomonas_euryale.AAC.1